MKIGIITIHNSPNYGASLQTFALYTYLVQQGYNVEIIDLLRPSFNEFKPSKKFKPYQHFKPALKQKIKKVITFLFIKQKKTINKIPQYTNPISLNKFNQFNSQLKYSQRYYSIDELYKTPPKYDIYITGSDQVWNPTQNYCLEPYFLTFVQNGKKISYASSIGIEELTKEEKKDFSKWLYSYNAISVRENTAKALLTNIIRNKEIKKVSDPTFLLNPKYWLELSIKPDIRNYILVFTLEFNSSIVNYALELGKQSNKQVIVLNQIQPIYETKKYISVYDAGPQEFLGYIANADLILTDSFHCTVFSIILKTKNFYTYIDPWNIRGSRIKDLLQTFHLENHLLKQDKSQTWEELNSNTINYLDIEKIFLSEQQDSRNYLLSQLHN